MFKQLLRSRRAWLLLLGVLLILLAPGIALTRQSPSAQASGGYNPSINVFPNPSSPGTSIEVTGSNYPPNVTVKVYFQNPKNGVITTVTDDGGFFNVQLTIPSTYNKGTHYYVHADSKTYSVKVLFTFTKVNLSINGPLTYGSQFQASGQGFAANETVDLTWDYGSLGQFRAGTVGTDSNGNFFITLTAPSFPFHVQVNLVATGRISGLSSTLPVSESPAVLISPPMGKVGTTVNLNGGGFGSSEPVKVLFQGKAVVTAKTNAKGAFKASFTVPDNARIGFQYNDIVATGKNSGVAAEGTFIVEPGLSIAPNHGFSGTLILAKGDHFTPFGTVILLWISPGGGSGGSGGGQFLGSVQASSNGTFKTTFFAPSGLISGRTYFVQAIDESTGGFNQVKFFVR